MPTPTPTQPQTVHFESPRKKRPREDAIIDINLTPAIDITFNLLIFFIMGTTFGAVEGLLPSALPTEQGVLQATPLPVTPIRIILRQTGLDRDEFKIAVDHWRFAPESFPELTGVLLQIRQRPGFDADTPVIIVADSAVRWDHVVNCFNAIRRADFARISFAAGGT